jgi:hypothetical protein
MDTQLHTMRLKSYEQKKKQDKDFKGTARPD